jgi:Holliday junction resolvase
MIYETEADRDRERRCATCLRATGFDVELTATLDPYDMDIWKGDTYWACGEVKGVKDYRIPMIREKGLAIDKTKVNGVLDAASRFMAIPLLFIEIKGKFYWTQLHPDYKSWGMKRRNRAGETRDPVYLIPANTFNPL